MKTVADSPRGLADIMRLRDIRSRIEMGALTSALGLDGMRRPLRGRTTYQFAIVNGAKRSLHSGGLHGLPFLYDVLGGTITRVAKGSSACTTTRGGSRPGAETASWRAQRGRFGCACGTSSCREAP